MELIQDFLAMGREGSWGDLAADAIGAAGGSLLLGFITYQHNTTCYNS